MRKIFSLLFIVFVSLSLLMQTAEAARFGGGRSFGMQRSVSGFSRMQSPSHIGRNATSTNRWLAPLAGLAAGGLLAYLFMGHGLGSGILSWLAIAAVGLLLWNFIRSKLNPATHPRQFNQQQTYDKNNIIDLDKASFTSANSYSSAAAHKTYPIGFDADTFLRDAKVQFIRLQASYDSKNLNDLREFTSPEVFAEIQLQLHERGDAVNQTEVVSLNAEIVDVESERQAIITSVQFTGMIRENINEAASPFKEIWHFNKDNASSTWIVAGVQQ